MVRVNRVLGAVRLALILLSGCSATPRTSDARGNENTAEESSQAGKDAGTANPPSKMGEDASGLPTESDGAIPTADATAQAPDAGVSVDAEVPLDATTAHEGGVPDTGVGQGPGHPPGDGPNCPSPHPPEPCSGAACNADLCHNGMRDSDESDIDCGGSCAKCVTGQRCETHTDCTSNACAPRFCDNSAGVAIPCEPAVCLATSPVSANHVALRVREFARDARDGTLYVSIDATDPSFPNSVAAFAPGQITPKWTLPLSGTVGPIDVSSDGSALYVGLVGTTPGVVRVALDTLKVSPPFSLGTVANTNRVVYPRELRVSPVDPDTVAVVGGQTGANATVGVHLFRNGEPLFDAENKRWQTNPKYPSLDITTVVWAGPKRLYGFNGMVSSAELATIDVSDSGLTVSAVLPGAIPSFSGKTQLVGDILFSPSGTLVDVARQTVVADLRGRNGMAVSDSGERVYFSSATGGEPLSVACFDARSLTYSGGFVFDPVAAPYEDAPIVELSLWGEHGLAIKSATRSTTRLLLLSDVLAKTPGCAPNVTPPTPVALDQPDATDGWIQTYYLKTNQVAFDEPSNRLYATISASDHRLPNRLVVLDLTKQAVISAPWVGSEPHALALSDDGSTAWVGFDSTTDFVSVDTRSYTLSPRYPVLPFDTSGAAYASRITMLPGSTSSALVHAAARNSTSQGPLQIFDQGRPRFSLVDASGKSLPAFPGASVAPISPTQLLVADSYRLPQSGLASVRIEKDGFALDWTLPAVITEGPISYRNGVVFGANGRFVRTSDQRLIGSIPPSYLSFDSPTFWAPNGLHVYSVRGEASPVKGKLRYAVKCYDTRNYAQTGAFTIDAPNPRIVGGATFPGVGPLDDSGLYIRDGEVLVVAPGVLNCVPGCAPDAPAPQPKLPVLPDAADATTQVFSLRSVGLSHNPVTRELYALIGYTDPRHGNELLTFDVSTPRVRAAVSVGAMPNALAISGDGRTAYVALGGASEVVPIELSTMTRKASLLLNAPKESAPWTAKAIAAMPGHFDTIAFRSVPLRPFGGELTVLTDTRSWYPGSSPWPLTDDTPLAFTDAQTLWGSSPSLVKLRLDATSFASVAPSSGLSPKTLVSANGTLLTGEGVVVDTSNAGALWQVPAQGAFTLTDDGKRVLVATGGYGALSVTCFDIVTRKQVGSATLTTPHRTSFDTPVTPIELERWGAHGLALRTEDNFLLVFPNGVLGMDGC